MRKQLIIGFTIALIALSLSLAVFATAEEPVDFSDQEVTITGMIKQEGDTFIIEGINDSQCTITGQDLSDMVGKKVQATGEFIKEKYTNRFNVTEIVELPDKKLERGRSPESGDK